jgi:glutaconate CoA-transferase subunit A
MLGSDLLEKLVTNGDAIQSVDPFSGSPVVMLPPIRPDVAILHVDRADTKGNAMVAGPSWSMKETALASRAVILVAEEVVDVGGIPPELVIVPGAAVTAVVPIKRGAHPTAVFGQYDFDRDHIAMYVDLSRRGPEGLTEYLDRFIYASSDHSHYLRLASGT